MSKLDLATLNLAEASEVVFDLELRHPATDQPLGLFIKLVGMQSDAVRAAVRVNTNEILKRNFEAQRKGVAKAPTAEDGDRRSAKVLAAGTVGWYEKTPADKPGEKDTITQGLPFDGVRLAFSPEEAERLYNNPGYDWLAKQVDTGIGETSNFLRG